MPQRVRKQPRMCLFKTGIEVQRQKSKVNLAFCPNNPWCRGQEALANPKSHKSFRPVTSATLRLSYAHAVSRWGRTLDSVETFDFHMVNVLLHGTVSLLCLPVVYFGLGARVEDFTPAVVAATLFAAHPIHSEAVQNITGRAELLMSFFYLLGFLCYCRMMVRSKSNAVSVLAQVTAIFLTLVFTVLALLSKEMGVTLPLLCSWWDFFVAQELSLRQILLLFFPRATLPKDEAVDLSVGWSCLSGRGIVHTDDAVFLRAISNANESNQSRSSNHTAGSASSVNPNRPTALVRIRGWAFRSVVLAAGTAVIAWWRLSLNGTAAHVFRYNSNRHALEPFDGLVPDELTVGGDTGVHGWARRFSLGWLWVRYFWHGCCCPTELGPDWSGPAIPLIRDPVSDPRAMALVIFVFWLLGMMFHCGCRAKTRPRVLMAVGFYTFPFLLSANVLVTTGTTVAERVAYLPSLGVCLGFALILTSDYNAGVVKSSGSEQKYMFRFWGPRSALFLLIAVAFGYKCHARNLAWTSSLTLWQEAYRVNPGSAHTAQNYAIQLLGSAELDGVAKAVEILHGVRFFCEVDRVDADEIYTTLALGLRRLNKWHTALEVLGEGWERLNDRQRAIDQGVKLWHMHVLDPSIEQISTRRARLLAAQGTTLAHLDLVEACRAMSLAISLAPDDTIVANMVEDFESYVARIST